VLAKLKEKCIDLVPDARAVEVDSSVVRLDDGASLPYDLLLWATGPGAPPIFSESGMATDEQGFVRVTQTLQAVSKGNVFAAGDCCSIDGCEWVPKAGE
jgi:selenide,water dikinase